jgi:hypothetical protein
MSSLRLLILPIVAIVVGALASCETGSKDVTPEYYTIDYTWSQDPDGGLTIKGQTDLPDSSEIDALLSKATPQNVDRAVEMAVLVGSTVELGSKQVRDGSFTIKLARAVPNSCGPQPPCGPFPGGQYMLLIDAKTPDFFAGGGPTTVDDPRYMPTTHGVQGFTGIEIAKEITLRPINICIGENGAEGQGSCGGQQL